MKLVILACLAAVALARPHEGDHDHHHHDYDHIEILRDERTDDGQGNFNYLFETENGIYKEVAGNPAPNGGTAMRGSFRFPLDDGEIVEVTFTADENGYVPESDHIPVPPPMPAHVLATLAKIEELVAQGATWDEQGRRLTRRK